MRSATACATRRTPSKVKSSAMTPRQPSVPKRIAVLDCATPLTLPEAVCYLRAPASAGILTTLASPAALDHDQPSDLDHDPAHLHDAGPGGRADDAHDRPRALQRLLADHRRGGVPGRIPDRPP